MPEILRSMLYVPANSWRMINNALSEGADAVILDLEDACPIAEKETGRIFARDALPLLKEHGVEAWVRVNSLETGLTETDLAYIVSPHLDGVMLAKTDSAEDLKKVEAVIQGLEADKGIEAGKVALAALLETPRAIEGVREIVRATPRLKAVAFGAGDFSREMGAGMGVTKLSPEEYFPMVLYARSAIALAARAAGVAAIDSPYFGLVIDLKGLAKESEKVRLLGFSGKQATHPRHVGPINQAFSPSEEEIDFAKRLVEAFDQAQAKGLGATSMGGKMIDYSSAKRARALLELADAVAAKTHGT
ncbi:MAG: HpcH/HpaI aldolase/citrate lyase family protein [Desulfobacteraceae bacterium]